MVLQLSKSDLVLPKPLVEDFQTRFRREVAELDDFWEPAG
jgi:hypothetical protein